MCSESANADGSWSFVRLSCAGVERTGCYVALVVLWRGGERGRKRERERFRGNRWRMAMVGESAKGFERRSDVLDEC